MRSGKGDRRVTSQQQADLLLREHQSTRSYTMLLEEWDIKIRPHLHSIELGAEMAKRHTHALLCRPEFPTLAMVELGECRRVLETALADVIAAQAIYASKARESDHAAA
jgi:hypothetical protein